MRTALIVAATAIALLLFAHTVWGRRASFMRGQPQVWAILSWTATIFSIVALVACFVDNDWWAVPMFIMIATGFVAIFAERDARRYVELYHQLAEDEPSWPTTTPAP